MDTARAQTHLHFHLWGRIQVNNLYIQFLQKMVWLVKDDFEAVEYL